MTASRTHVLVQRPIASRPAGGAIHAFSTCRNERLRLPAFLAHYRGLGIDRFFIVDDGSSDGSVEYLLDQPDVHLFRATTRFGDAREGVDWVNGLLAEFGVGGWCVTVDIDELLVYPGSEDTPLRRLTGHLDRHGYQAVACLLVDLYPAGRLADVTYVAGDDVFAAAPYFDPGPYERVPIDLCPGILVRGGMRARVFYPGFRSRGPGIKAYEGIRGRAARRLPWLHDVKWLRWHENPPVLTKVPLVRWDRESRYLSPHWVSARTVAPVGGVLLHFKFLADFHARALADVARGEHAVLSEYRRYVDRLRGNPDFTFMYEGSTRFQGSAQLVELGLMDDTQQWADDRRSGGA